jgi:hypothetical protein
MQGYHYVFLAVVLVVGYAVGRYFPGPGQAVGLP